MHTIVLAEESGDLKIRSYRGGISVQRMDTDTPFGPILIITIDDSSETTPAGPLLFKSIPRSIVPRNVNLIPLQPIGSDS
jgi:hypothetical protein